MNIVKHDPIRVRFQSDRHIFNINPMGTKITLYRDYRGEDPVHDFLLSIKTKDTKPHQPNKESFKDTLDKLLEQFEIKQDRIRTHNEHNIFDKDFKKHSEWKTRVDVKKFSKDNRYDLLIDKIDFDNPDKAQKNPDGQIGKVRLD